MEPSPGGFVAIERAEHPLNPAGLRGARVLRPRGPPQRFLRFAELFVRESEEIQAKVRSLVRYVSMACVCIILPLFDADRL
jgi:hypothetical protein